MVRTFEEQGIRTVFEGIEEGWQLDLAEKSGASMVQGYVLARPELAPTSFRVFAEVATPVAIAPPNETFPAASSSGPGRPARTFGRRSAS
jgi:EAL domain-containing protein (putative c-di-GMP-specific phosphodiesterase class I)